jgi:hypothetical protein
VTPVEKRWSGHVAAWAASGLSCKAYAAKARVNPHTLAGWRWKLRRSTPPTRAEPKPGDPKQGGEPSFLEVTEQLAATLAQEASVIELDVRGGLVRVRGPVDARALLTVLSVMEGRR